MSSAQSRQYLTFMLDGEEFALETTKVREVLDYTTITRVPRMPEFLKGVINLRGNVVPVIDMRMKLGMPQAEQTVNTCIVIIEVDYEAETIVMGGLVDSVQEVMEMTSDFVEPPPKMGMRLNAEFIEGMGKQNDKFIIILNIDKVLSSEELSIVQEAGDTGSAVEPDSEDEAEGINMEQPATA